eukprot:gene9594-14897_t
MTKIHQVRPTPKESGYCFIAAPQRRGVFGTSGLNPFFASVGTAGTPRGSLQSGDHGGGALLTPPSAAAREESKGGWARGKTRGQTGGSAAAELDLLCGPQQKRVWRPKASAHIPAAATTAAWLRKQRGAGRPVPPDARRGGDGGGGAAPHCPGARPWSTQGPRQPSLLLQVSRDRSFLVKTARAPLNGYLPAPPAAARAARPATSGVQPRWGVGGWHDDATTARRCQTSRTVGTPPGAKSPRGTDDGERGTLLVAERGTTMRVPEVAGFEEVYVWDVQSDAAKSVVVGDPESQHSRSRGNANTNSKTAASGDNLESDQQLVRSLDRFTPPDRGCPDSALPVSSRLSINRKLSSDTATPGPPARKRQSQSTGSPDALAPSPTFASTSPLPTPACPPLKPPGASHSPSDPVFAETTTPPFLSSTVDPPPLSPDEGPHKKQQQQPQLSVTGRPSGRSLSIDLHTEFSAQTVRSPLLGSPGQGTGRSGGGVVARGWSELLTTSCDFDDAALRVHRSVSKRSSSGAKRQGSSYLETDWQAAASLLGRSGPVVAALFKRALLARQPDRQHLGPLGPRAFKLAFLSLCDGCGRVTPGQVFDIMTLLGVGRPLSASRARKLRGHIVADATALSKSAHLAYDQYVAAFGFSCSWDAASTLRYLYHLLTGDTTSRFDSAVVTRGELETLYSAFAEECRKDASAGKPGTDDLDVVRRNLRQLIDELPCTAD